MATTMEDQAEFKNKPLVEWQLDLADRWEKLPAEDLVRELARVRHEKDDLEKLLADVEWQHEYLRLVAIVKSFENRGINTLTVNGVGRVTLQGDVYARIPASSRAAAFEWLRDHGHGDLITETVNASTLKAAAKKMLKQGEPLPENLFAITPYSRAQLTPI